MPTKTTKAFKSRFTLRKQQRLMDLYNVLGVARDATNAEIKKAYRKLALSFHPDKAAEHEKEESERKFKNLSEAYVILTEPSLRDKYDQNGHEDINKSKPANDDYDSKEIFESFFDEKKSILRTGLHDTVDFRSRKNSAKAEENLEKPKDLPLSCSLEEIYTGVQKILRVTRNRRVHSKCDQDKYVEESTILEVQINPGVTYGKKLIFKGEGDEAQDQLPADIVFTITEEPHERFQREGHDLVFFQQITLIEALTECTVKITTIGGRTLSIPCPEVIHSNYERRIIGEGMPRAENSDARGDLVIRFVTQFPKMLSRKVKNELRRVMSMKEC